MHLSRTAACPHDEGMVNGVLRSGVPPVNARVASLGGSPIRELLRISTSPGMISFASGSPANELFDVAGVARSYAEVLAAEGPRALQYSSTEGEPELRARIGAFLTAKGIWSTAEDIIITSGSQQGLGLIGQVVLEEGAVVLTENPTFVSALQAFALGGAQFRAVETDEHGMVPEALEAAIVRHSPRAVYTIPTFQNPTGVTTPRERRNELADVLARHDVWLIEDDPYSEIRFRAEPHSPIASDPRLAGKSLYLGTLSKILAPGLRIGWIRGPQEILDVLTTTKQGMSLQTSTIDQLAALHWWEHNDLEEKLDPVRAEYMRRRDTMVDGLAHALPEGSTFNRPDGGMFVWASLPEPYDANHALSVAIADGVVYIPGSHFYVADPVPGTLRLSFVSTSVERIEEGIERLHAVFTHDYQI